MPDAALTPEDYERELEELERRLQDYVERGEGERKQLRRDAQSVLALRGEFPNIYARHTAIEGLIADLLAREQQEKFVATEAPREAPGCMFGWLLRRKEG